MPDPFPSELVEAAAVVCYSLAPEHDTSTYPHGYVPYDEARPSSRENARADALEVLTALYPLIEQRVIDKLAREAAGGPVPDDHPGVLASLGPLCTLTMDTSERERVKMAQIVIHAARPYLVACGVAAERARWEEGREALTWIANADEDAINAAAEACENPGHVENHQDGPEWFCPDCGSGWWATDGTGPMCEINYVVAGVARRALAALAPERTTGEGDARLRAAFDEVCDELDREGT